MNKISKGVFCALMFVCDVSAAHFTTTVAQPQNFDWFEPIWLPGPVSVSPGNTYQVLEGGIVRNPISNPKSTFPGDSLTLESGSIFRIKPPQGGVTTTVHFPGMNGTPGLILNGGGVDPGTGSTLFVITGKMLVSADSFVLGPFTSPGGRNLVLASSVEGTGSLTIQGFFENTGVTVQSENNNYSGDWWVSSGRLTGMGRSSLGTGDISIAPGSRLEIQYDIVSPGVLFLQGRHSMMDLSHNCQFSGAVINGEMLPPGTFSFAQLKALFPDNFPAMGSGSIRIVPLQPRLSIVAVDDKVNVAFTTGYGHSYTLQAKALEQPGTWQRIGDSVIGDGASKTMTLSRSGGGVLYRMVVE